jgi:putative salt-induced outer membrane protein YdiY
MKAPRFLSFLLFFLLSTSLLHADKVMLDDGSILVGTITKMVDGELHIKTKFADDIAIPADQIDGLETQEPKPVHLSDGSVIKGTLEVTEAGQIKVVRSRGNMAIPVTANEITAINPTPPPPPKKPDWDGSVVGSMTITDGNSDTKSISLTADATKRSETDRIILRGGYFYASDDNEGIRDEQFLSGKYDYFFTDRFFTYGQVSLDRDVIKELELRTTAGGGLGYQFLENDVYNLFGEAGLSVVNENYSFDDDDETYMAARFAGQFDWWIIEDKLKFEEVAEFLLSVDNVDDWIGISDSALIWQWTERWSSNAGVRFEYDNTPATGQEEMDTKYTLGIGYSF